MRFSLTVGMAARELDYVSLSVAVRSDWTYTSELHSHRSLTFWERARLATF